jgi:hypothetical protein
MLGNEARGLDLFRSGTRNVVYGNFEAPEGAKLNMKTLYGRKHRRRKAPTCFEETQR